MSDLNWPYGPLGVIWPVHTQCIFTEVKMAQTFSFDTMNNTGSNLNLDGVSLNYHRSGDLIYSSRHSGTGIYSGNSSPSSVGVSASVNNVPVFSTNSPALYNPNNRGSSLGSSAVSSSGGSSSSGGMSTQDWINLGLGVAQLGYNIFNTERNWNHSQRAYDDNLARDERNYDLDANGFTNLVRQMAQAGLNPLMATGNGTSIGSAPQFEAPQHGSIDFMSTLSFIDKLRTSQMERELIKAQANRTNALTVAQALVNEKTEAQIEKTLADKGFTFEKIDKTKEEINRLKQLVEITDYDFDVTKTGIGARYKDSTPEAIKVANTLAGYQQNVKDGTKTNFGGAIGSVGINFLLNLLKMIL